MDGLTGSADAERERERDDLVLHLSTQTVLDTQVVRNPSSFYLLELQEEAFTKQNKETATVFCSALRLSQNHLTNYYNPIPGGAAARWTSARRAALTTYEHLCIFVFYTRMIIRSTFQL